MNIAILTSGILPVPAVQGGAVENLVDFYLKYNDRHRLHDITVYSVWHPDVDHHPALQSQVNHYRYVKVGRLWDKLRKRLYHKTHGEEYYHYTIEYFLNEAIKDIRTRQFDVIILENRPGYALKLKSVTDARLVYHLHNEKLDSHVLRCQEIYDAATRIVTVSDFIKSKILTINPHDTKTVTVHNGIDLDAFTPSHPADRLAFGLQPRDFLLVYSGRVNREKGIMELIRAMAMLKDQPDIKLIIIGSSFFGNVKKDDYFMTELKKEAAPLKDRILFTGFVPYAQMPDYLSMADAAVIPSVWNDPFPTTVLEAQAMGLPIIATRRGGIPEEVTDANAILLNTDDHFVTNLAQAIRHLYDHPELRRQMRDASLQRAHQFDEQTYATNFLRAIED